MMNTIVDEKLISFKELEQKIFNYVCELGREMTQIILESYDNELASARDRTKYRDKGKRSTTGIFPRQESNRGLLHCWQILYS